jgi:hypothetical protein
VTLIAVNAVVDVTTDARVIRVRRGGRMASRTLKDRIVGGIGVACRANALSVAVVGGEISMIERCSCPHGCCMARLASGGKSRSRVIGIVRALIIRFVTAVAVGWKARVVVVHVATGARNRGVCSGKRELRVVVVKSSLSPDNSVVAHVASNGESALNVIHRRRGVVEIGLVAGNARRTGEVIVVVDVAGSAGHGYMRPGQSPAGRGVIECDAQPRCG